MKTIIGYASLMSQESAKKTCDVFDFNYGYIKGYSRIFNKLGFNPHTKTYNKNSSMLNVFDDDDIWLIISYFDIHNIDYEKMQEREIGYDKSIVDIYNFNKEIVGKGVLFIAQESIIHNGTKIQLIRDDLQPEKRYLDLCIDALSQTNYLDHFLDSTYMGCGKKKLTSYVGL